MPTKKSTPAKKATPKKKIIVGKPNANWVGVEEPRFIEAYLKKYGNANIVDETRKLGAIAPPAGETRVSELEAENNMLRQLLQTYEAPKVSLPMPGNKPAPMSTMLTKFCEEMDGQLSRLLNSVNMLERTTERIQSTDNKQGTAMGNSERVDLSFRLSRLVEDFSYQNMRLEDLNAKLNNLI